MTPDEAIDGERLAVFGYGSLVSRDSIAETLGREAPAPVPAQLAGWRRRWSVYRKNTAHEKTFERVDGEPFEHIVGLNIERAPDAPEAEWPNGVLIELTEAELERLDGRELRYDRVEVTDGVVADELRLRPRLRLHREGGPLRGGDSAERDHHRFVCPGV